jgi:hypothetical protein
MGERKSFLLRIDEELWTQLERWAQDELRSVNGKIEYILRQAVMKRTGETLPSAPAPSGKTTVRKK